jgi:hypothetical protein
MSTLGGALDAKRHAETGRGWYAVVARTGLVAKGLSFGLVGALAIALAVGSGGKATSREGALAQLSHHLFGKVVLIALAVGFGAGLAFTTLKILFGSGGGGSQTEKAHRSTAMALGWPAGRYLVAAAGIVVIGVGLWNLYRGIARKFEDKWRVASLSATVRTWGARAGVVGHVARFVVFGLIGLFLVRAAIDYDPKDAIGLDGALQKLAHASYGSYLLGLTAAGLVAYGVYCLVDARLRDVST